jgi:hypothetical protein
MDGRWTSASLAESEFVEVSGSDDSQDPVVVSLGTFLDYAHTQQDDDPLYAFDSTFDPSPADFSIPPTFRHDLLACLGPNRPPWRWLLIGPTR